MERRVFLSRVVSFLSFITAALFSLPLLRFLVSSLKESQDESSFQPIRTDAPELGEEIAQVRLTRVVREGWQKRIAEESVWVKKKADGSYVVFDTHCTHLGCAVSWNPEAEQFQCPCHGGRFDSDGNRVAGPPPRPLNRYETKIDRNMLTIGKILKT